jgi:hypothetical protein
MPQLQFVALAVSLGLKLLDSSGLVGEATLHSISFDVASRSPLKYLVYESESPRYIYFQELSSNCLSWVDPAKREIRKSSVVYSVNHKSGSHCSKPDGLLQTDTMALTPCRAERCGPDADYQVLFLGPGQFDGLLVSDVPYFGGEVKLSDRDIFSATPDS